MFNLFQPIQQDPGYHNFADPTGSLVSNLAFLAVALYGLRLWKTSSAARRLAYLGCLLVSLGSAWYHAQPSDASLLWDRLPMTIVFAAVFTEAVASFRTERARWMLWPLAALGMASVVWWQATGDLRPYALVQFGPMLALPILIDFRRDRSLDTRPWWLLLGLYTLAKFLEIGDVWLHDLTAGLVGGHTLKHLAAAAALFAWTSGGVKRRQEETETKRHQDGHEGHRQHKALQG
jgi:hypothetical protein